MSSSWQSVRSTLASGLSAGYDALVAGDARDKERVEGVLFTTLEVAFEDHGTGGTGPGTSGTAREGGGNPPAAAEPVLVPVVALLYRTGWQLWDVSEPDVVRELVSKRDGPIRCVEALPAVRHAPDTPLHGAGPLLALGAANGSAAAAAGDPALREGGGKVSFYSLRQHCEAAALPFTRPVHTLAANRRGLLLVALAGAQLHTFRLDGLQHCFSVLALPPPEPREGFGGGSSGGGAAAVPIALGSRWLAYASNQAAEAAPKAAAARARNGSGAGDGVGARVGTVAWDVASSSGKHVKALGAASYKYLVSQYGAWRAGANGGPPPGADAAAAAAAAAAGTVAVRDVLSRRLVAEFRAHGAALTLLRWDPSGTLLATASVSGQSVKVWRVLPPAPARGAGTRPGVTREAAGSARQLFRLSRGLTPATIIDIAFSHQSDWVAVTSAHGTTHLFRLQLPQQGSGSAALPLQAAAACLDPCNKPPPLQVLRPIARLRGGSVVANSMPGAAAASSAASLVSSLAGGERAAAAFVSIPAASDDLGAAGDGDGDNGDTLLDEALYACSGGALVRYALRVRAAATPPAPSVVHEAAAYAAVAMPLTGDGIGAEPGAAAAGTGASASMVLEPVGKWELARRQGAMEHEDDVVVAPPALPLARTWSGGELWLSYCENDTRPHTPPLWADPQWRAVPCRAPVADALEAQVLDDA